MKNKREIGSFYETQVAAVLEAQGYEILEQNFRCRFGEVDLIARHQGYLVFVEVKYRSNVLYGSPAEAVGHKKQQRISNCASFYLYSRHYPLHTPCRFDVAAVGADGIHVYENAFPYEGQFLR